MVILYLYLRSFKFDSLNESLDDFAVLIRILCDATEYDELPVRHNEDLMNERLENSLNIPINAPETDSIGFGGVAKILNYDDPHAKAFLLLQCHLERFSPLPCSDYSTDTTSILDQAIRVLQAMLDIAAEKRFLSTARGVCKLIQCVKQGLWPTDSILMILPEVDREMASKISFDCSSPKNVLSNKKEIDRVFGDSIGQSLSKVISSLPLMTLDVDVTGKKDL